MTNMQPRGDCPKCGNPDPAFGPPIYREEEYFTNSRGDEVPIPEYLAWPCVSCGYERHTLTLEQIKAATA